VTPSSSSARRPARRAHARSGDRIAIAAYLGKGDSFDRALVEFAERYADQSERDYAVMMEAVRSGRLQAEPAPA
jgi:predicted alpha/beta hydrolase